MSLPECLCGHIYMNKCVYKKIYLIRSPDDSESGIRHIPGVAVKLFNCEVKL